MAKLSPVLPGIAAAALAMMAALTTVEQTKMASAFQAPIIFPLLWMAKRLTYNNHNNHNNRPRIPLMPPLAGTIKSLVANGVGRKDDDNNSMDRMIEWLDEFEGTISNVEVDTNSFGLRGLYATKDIRKGGVVVEIPYTAALMVGDTLWGTTMYDDFDDVPGSDDWSEDDLDDAYQGLNFLQSFANDEEYAAYVANLPAKPTSGDDAGTTPDFWSEEHIVGLEVPSYVEEILNRKRIVREVAKRNDVDEDDLRWATWMIRSRRFTTWNMVDDPDGDDESLFGVFPMRSKPIEQIQGFLTPLIDMANHAHDPNSEMKISVNRWTREFDDTSSFALKALRPIKKGEEVTLMYGDGDRTSLVMLDKYGFFLEGNEADDTIDWEEESKTEFTTSLEEDEAQLTMLEGKSNESKKRVLSKAKGKLKTVVSKIQDYEVSFSSEIDGLPLVGSGMRQKMGIKIYAVAMYGAPALLESSSNDELRNVARSFGSESPRTTFVLDMILRGDAETISDAIANSVKLRYGGPPADVLYLESLIAEGLKERGRKTKGSILQFDCTEEGVSVTVDGEVAGTAKFEGLGSAFVDVFMDENAVSPSLVDDCLKRGGSAEEAQAEESVGGAATVTENVTDSKRTMLSLRVLMKRLSNWKMPITASLVADEAVAPGENEEKQEELLDAKVVDNEEGSDFLDTASDVTGEDDAEILVSSSNDKIDIATPADDDELEMSELAVEDEPELSESADEDEIESSESTDETMEEVTAINQEDTPESVLMNAVEEDTEAPLPTPPSSDAVAIEDSSTFNVDAIQAKIQELEAEIEAELERVKSQGLPSAEVSSEAQASATAADPVPDSGNGISVQDNTEDNPAELEEDIYFKVEEEEIQRAANEAAEKSAVAEKGAAEARQQNEAVESKMKPLKDKATGVNFDPKLEDGLYLVGVGVRKKAIINVYSVAMYSSPSALKALSPFPPGKQKQNAQTALRNAAGTFNDSSTMTSFVLEMVFKADAQTIAGAIADGIRPRYSGSAADVKQLEAFIIDGVKGKGGQATKGTIFRFDCTAGGVEVSVDGIDQGMANFEGMGSALVDVFMDDKAVSPQLVASCLDTWCGSGIDQ